MSIVKCQISISVDGYVAGPNQSIDNPIGEGGMGLHQWAFANAEWNSQHGQDGEGDELDSQVVADSTRNVGAYVMGRNMFDPGRGAWDESWQGWWGEDPPTMCRCSC